MNNTVKTLKEKYDNQEREENYLWSQLLKRKRLEQNRTLEEVSKGICSPSYLSKIENGQVDADAIYYKALFEKLDLKYEKEHEVFKLWNKLQFEKIEQLKQIDKKL